MSKIYEIMNNYILPLEGDEVSSTYFPRLTGETLKEICTVLAKQEVEIKILKEQIKNLENKPTE